MSPARHDDGVRRLRATLSPPGTPPSGALATWYANLEARSKITGCYIGLKKTGGRTTGRVSLVCRVDIKVPDRELTDRGKRIPRRYEWMVTSKNRKRISTDVVEGPARSSRQTPFLGPGDRAESGTVGIAIDHPVYGRVVTTAAHLFVPEDRQGEWTYPLTTAPPVRLRNSDGAPFLTGRLVRAVQTEIADYAVVVPNSSDSTSNAFQDRYPLGGITLLGQVDLDRALYVATSSGLYRTKLEGIAAVVPVGKAVFRNAILTSRVTMSGDSGCSLVTNDSRVCGLLVGFWGNHSVFMSPLDLLTRESARLAERTVQ